MVDSPPTLARVPCLRGNRLQITWGSGNELKLCEIGGSGQNAAVHNIQWGCQNAAERQVACDSQNVYAELQMKRRSTLDGDARASPDWWESALTYSRSISRILSESCDSAQGTSTLQGGYMALQRAIWELLEIFFVNKGDLDGVVTEEMVQWLQRHSAILTGEPTSTRATFEDFQRMLEGESRPARVEDTPGYWPLICRLAAIGWTREVLELLGKHSVFMMYQHVLPNMQPLDPSLQPQREVMEASLGDYASDTAYTSVTEYNHYREGWRHQCQEILSDASLWEHCPVPPASLWEHCPVPLMGAGFRRRSEGVGM
ncbi:hypothetical protein CYMTET_53296, partial [Cymbomonas tetramitiformis]